MNEIADHNLVLAVYCISFQLSHWINRTVGDLSIGTGKLVNLILKNWNDYVIY
jgi:hypothetical protein